MLYLGDFPRLSLKDRHIGTYSAQRPSFITDNINYEQLVAIAVDTSRSIYRCWLLVIIGLNGYTYRLKFDNNRHIGDGFADN